MKWPEVGGGCAIGSEIDEEELFMKMCAWDDQNYIMGAGTRAGSDNKTTDGLVDGHAYSVITCVNDVAGTEFDMIKMRNPWGGIFWVEKHRFFTYFSTIYISCSDMTHFLEDAPQPSGGAGGAGGAGAYGENYSFHSVIN